MTMLNAKQIANYANNKIKVSKQVLDSTNKRLEPNALDKATLHMWIAVKNYYKSHPNASASKDVIKNLSNPDDISELNITYDTQHPVNATGSADPFN